MVVSETVLPAGVLGAVLGVVMLIPVSVFGHCDTMK